MKRQGGSKIINIGSMMSIFGGAYAAPYFVVEGRDRADDQVVLGTAWAKDNIQVNAVLPGWIDTELTQNARDQVTGLNERVPARTPAGALGRPGRFVGDRGIPRSGRVRLRDGRGHPGGRRIRIRVLGLPA